MGVPPNHAFVDGILHYTPSIWGYPHLWKPHMCGIVCIDLIGYVICLYWHGRHGTGCFNPTNDKKTTLPGLKYVFSYPRIQNSIRYTWYVFLNELLTNNYYCVYIYIYIYIYIHTIHSCCLMLSPCDRCGPQRARHQCGALVPRLEREVFRP